jgi:hypothetical protein
MLEFIDQDATLCNFGYKIPEQSSDKCYLICHLGNHSVESTLRALKRTFKKRGTYRCLKCISKSVEGREQRSSQSKKAWSDPDFANRIALKSKENANSEQGRKIRSLQAKEAWKNLEYKELHTARITNLFQSESHKALVSERNRESYILDSEKYLKDKVSALRTEKARINHRKAVSCLEYKELHSKLAKKRSENDSYKARIAKGLESFPRGGKMSNPELEIKKILENLGVDFVYNKSVGPYNFDFYIEKYDLYIEVQGEYWHSLPNNIKRDLSKYSYIRSACPSSKLIYVWDYDFYSGNAEYKLKTALDLDTSKNIFEFDFKDVVCRQVESSEARRFLNCWHYAQFGKAGKFIIGTYLNDVLIAVAKIGPVSRKEIAGSLGYSPKECFELDRFCIHPFYQKKNLGSFHLGRTAREFFASYPGAKAIVSFADSTFGHEGTIYKASNWVQVGITKPDYVYRSPDGWIMHKKTLYNQAASVHMTEAAYVEKHGYQKIYGKEKTKFILKRPDR